jgi:hypothetical protein
VSKQVLAPVGMYERSFVEEVLKAYHGGLSIVQISAYFGDSEEHINHVLDLYLPIEDVMGRPFEEDEEKDE